MNKANFHYQWLCALISPPSAPFSTYHNKLREFKNTVWAQKVELAQCLILLASFQPHLLHVEYVDMSLCFYKVCQHHFYLCHTKLQVNCLLPHVAPVNQVSVVRLLPIPVQPLICCIILLVHLCFSLKNLKSTSCPVVRRGTSHNANKLLWTGRWYLMCCEEHNKL